MPKVVVIGAGVSGLTCALLLSKLEGYEVTVVARHMPGDLDVEYTSPWAGANVLPMNSEANSRWERRTWPELARLAAEVPEAGIHFQLSRVFRRSKDFAAGSASAEVLFDDALFDPSPWWSSLFADFRVLGPADLVSGGGDVAAPPGVDGGCQFTAVCINTVVYLSWLVGQLRARGVAIRRGVLGHVAEAPRWWVAPPHTSAPPPPDAPVLVVNCSGLLACRLGGVMDGNVVPARGQTVLVRNTAPYMVCTSGVDPDEETGRGGDAAGELCYAMTRAAGGGTILGGTYQKGNWTAEPDQETARRIMRRAVEACPGLVPGGLEGVAGKDVQGKGWEEGLDVVRHNVGLRPLRIGGVRIEKEKMDGGLWVVHNYGHAGWGYQGSYGCAERVVELVAEVVAEMK